MYSFIASCKAAGVDPREWFTYALDNIYKYDTTERMIELLPSNFKNLKPKTSEPE